MHFEKVEIFGNVVDFHVQKIATFKEKNENKSRIPFFLAQLQNKTAYFRYNPTCSSHLLL